VAGLHFFSSCAIVDWRRGAASSRKIRALALSGPGLFIDAVPPSRRLCAIWSEAARWLRSLGEDPSAYDAVTIRNIVLDQPANRSHKSVRLTATVLRAYLRFLAASGVCRPELVHAVPYAPRRRDAALPRFISRDR
jgi:hypothetical protein